MLNDLQATLVLATQKQVQGVMVDFTHPSGVYENVRTEIAYGVRPLLAPPDSVQDKFKTSPTLPKKLAPAA